MLNAGEREEVPEKFPVKKDKARETFDMVLRKGETPARPCMAEGTGSLPKNSAPRHSCTEHVETSLPYPDRWS